MNVNTHRRLIIIGAACTTVGVQLTIGGALKNYWPTFPAIFLATAIAVPAGFGYWKLMKRMFPWL